MISKDIKAYASEHWEQCIETVTRISQDDQKHHSLVANEQKYIISIKLHAYSCQPIR